MDFYFDESGDIRVSPNRDIAVTDSPWRDDAQQAYIRVQTEMGDFLLYPTLGAELTKLFGMPQSAETGALGAAMITEALNREGRFVGREISVVPVPTSHQTIRFDIYIKLGSRRQLLLSVEQDLGVNA